MFNDKETKNIPYTAPKIKAAGCFCEQGYAFSMMRTWARLE